MYIKDHIIIMQMLIIVLINTNKNTSILLFSIRNAAIYSVYHTGKERTIPVLTENIVHQ